MSLFNQDEKILVRIGEPSARQSKDELKMVIPCVFVVPTSVAEQQLVEEFDLDHRTATMGALVDNPHVQGTLQVEDKDHPPKYRAVIWPASDNPKEQEEHYKKPPVELEDVQLGRFTAYPSGEYEGSVMVTQQITAPFRSDTLFGKIGRLAGTSVRMQISELQTKLALPEGGDS